MPLAGTKTKTKTLARRRRNTFGITLPETSADQLRAAAERLSLPPTTLAAQLLVRALQDREPLSGPSLSSEPPPNDGKVLGALAALATDLLLVRKTLAALMLHRPTPAPRSPLPGPASPDVLLALHSVSNDLRGLKRAHHNAALKLLQAGTGMSRKELEDWASLHLNDQVGRGEAETHAAARQSPSGRDVTSTCATKE